jgi:hypothetical protein
MPIDEIAKKKWFSEPGHIRKMFEENVFCVSCGLTKKPGIGLYVLNLVSFVMFRLGLGFQKASSEINVEKYVPAADSSLVLAILRLPLPFPQILHNH